MVMESMFQMVLDLPGLRVTEVARTKQGEWVLRVESTLSTTACSHCGRTIAEPRGRGERIRLRHLPVFDRPVFVELRPKRFGCRSCEGEPVTTQTLDWYDERTRTTHAYAARHGIRRPDALDLVAERSLCESDVLARAMRSHEADG